MSFLWDSKNHTIESENESREKNGRLKMNNKREFRVMMNRMWQMFLKMFTIVSLVNLLLFIPALKYGDSLISKVIIVISVAWLILIIISNWKEESLC